MEFRNWNANYFGSNASNPKGDCFIRAACASTMYGYKHICDLLGVEFIMGSGYGHRASDGITPEQADKLAKDTGLLVRLTEEGFFTDDDVVYEYMENMLPIDLEESGVQASSFIVMCRSSVNGDWHATAFYVKGGKLVHVDVESCRNSIYSIPEVVYAVPRNMVCKKEDPNYYTTERNRILKQWAEEGFSKLKKQKKI